MGIFSERNTTTARPAADIKMTEAEAAKVLDKALTSGSTDALKEYIESRLTDGNIAETCKAALEESANSTIDSAWRWVAGLVAAVPPMICQGAVTILSITPPGPDVRVVRLAVRTKGAIGPRTLGEGVTALITELAIDGGRVWRLQSSTWSASHAVAGFSDAMVGVLSYRLLDPLTARLTHFSAEVAITEEGGSSK